METPVVLEHPHLRKLHADFETVNTTLQTLREVHTTEQLCWKPDPKTWNLLECVDHLRATGTVYYPLIQDCLARTHAEDRRGDDPYQPRWVGRQFIGLVDPASTRKVKTFRIFYPETHLEDVTVFDRFMNQQNTLATFLKEADGYDLNGRKFPSPASRLLRFTLGEGLTLIVMHQQRHLLQMQNLTKRPDFPAA